MGSLILGVAGAVAGNLLLPGIGGSLGFAVGSTLGSALDPQKVKGPRLQDLTLQRSQYGQMIPIVYGAIRIAGNVIWQTDLVEHKHKQGGKGGPKVTTYTYTASFAVLLCEGPDVQVLRVWADSRLVYDATGGTPGIRFVLYPGSETQLADPTMEADLGAGNVPAHRGHAYVVFTDLDLGEFGNRIPLFTFEVSTNARVNAHIRVVQQNNDAGFQWGGDHDFNPNQKRPSITQWVYPAASPPSDIRVLENSTSNVVTYDPTTLETTGSSTASGESYPANILLVQASPPHNEILYIYAGDHVLSSGTRIPLYVHPAFQIGSGTVNVGLAGGGVSISGDNAVVSQNFGASAGIPGNEYPGVVIPSADGRSTYVFTSVDGRPDTGGFNIEHWFKIINGLVVDSGTCDPPVSYSMIGMGRAYSGYNYVVSVFENDQPYCWNYTGAGLKNVWLSSIIGGVFAHTDPVGGTLPSSEEPAGIHCTESYTFATINVLSPGYAGVVAGKTLAIVTRWPIGASNDVLLSDIVADLSDRAGLEVEEYDVAQLTDPVHGFVIANQGDARSAVAPLQTAYYFDAVESGTLVKFVKRGALPELDIPDEELAAHEDKGESPPLLTFVRAKEVDLPRRVTTVYIDQDAAYQNGSQVAQRIVTTSKLEATAQLPIAMTATHARQIADRILWSGWYERDTFTFTTARKYAWLEPTGVVTAHARTLRITGKEEQPPGVIKWQGVQTLGPIFVRTSTGDGGGGYTEPVVTPPQATQLVLLDIPYIVDPARQNVYWAAMAGAARESWRGAGLYQSKDAINYAVIGAGVDPDVIGSADTVLANFIGGNVFDERNAVNVTIGPGGGELSSTTVDGVLNGVNTFVLGSELLRARDAVLVSGSTYRLSGLLRGRHGTEWAMTTHVAGERFIALPTVELAYAMSDVGPPRQYKAVTSGNSLESTVAQSFTLQGISLKPYAPVHALSGRNAAGDWLLSWVRRARVNADWLDYADVPLDETSEKYLVTLWTDATRTSVAAYLESPVPQGTLTALAQTTIFGSIQSVLYWSVAQVGRLGPGYAATGQ